MIDADKHEYACNHACFFLAQYKDGRPWEFKEFDNNQGLNSRLRVILACFLQVILYEC